MLPSHAFTFSGEKPTAESVADAIADTRAELLHLPSSFDLGTPLPTKECPTCDGTVRIMFVDKHDVVVKNFLCLCFLG